MTPQEHYAKAEEILAQTGPGQSADHQQRSLLRAQVHATLATVRPGVVITNHVGEGRDA